MPPKFGHKIRRHKQRCGKIATTVVLDKICYDQGCNHRSGHSNEIAPLSILLAAVFLGTRNWPKSLMGAFPPVAPPRCS